MTTAERWLWEWSLRLENMERAAHRSGDDAEFRRIGAAFDELHRMEREWLKANRKPPAPDSWIVNYLTCEMQPYASARGRQMAEESGLVP